MLSDRFVSTVRDAAVITDAFPGVELKRSGSRGDAVTLCPWHNDHSPSLTINTQKNVCYCHVCGEGGDTIKALRLINGFTFEEAILHLAELHNIPVEHDNSEAAEKSMAAAEHRREVIAANEAKAAEWHDNLMNKAPPKYWEYLASRGVVDAAADWQIGAGRAEEWWNQPRLVIPMHDRMGKVVAFVARDLDWVKGKKPGKWINSRNEPGIYEKSRHVFALNRVAKTTRQHDSVLVVEGQLDAIACHLAGLTNAVGVGGKFLTLDHVQQIKQATGQKKLTLALDGDAAGLDGMDKMLNELLPLLVKSQLDLHLATLPDGKDPADLGAEMVPLVASAPIWFEWWWGREIGKIDTGNAAQVQNAQQVVRRMLGRLPEGAAFTYISERSKADLAYRPRVKPQPLIKFVTREECYWAEHRTMRLALHHAGARGCLAEATLSNSKLQQLQALLLMLRDHGITEERLVSSMGVMVSKTRDSELRDEMRSIATPLTEIGIASRRMDPIEEMEHLLLQLDACAASERNP